MPVAERVAIVGVAGRFPGAGADLDLFWDQTLAATDNARPVPDGRWLLPPSECLDPRPGTPDTVYSSRGYFLEPFTPDLAGLDVPTELVANLDPLFHLILDCGNRAFRGANIGPIDRRRAGVILGNICLPTEKASDLAREFLAPRRRRGSAPDFAAPTHPFNRYAAGLPAGLLAQSLHLGGGSFTLDAACASSVYALKLACDELLTHRADFMLAGGASRPDALYTQMGFCQLRALSVRGVCSPFDAAADGLVVGEGAAIFALKRLTDAVRHDDDIIGVICGVGLSNDAHGNLLAPAREGQLRAMRSAYQQAGWKTTAADVIECHATGTPVGDAVEFAALRELWGETGWTPGICSIGSVKSTVGHLLTGAGAAALTKVLLAMRHGQRPPQANFTTPNPALNYAGGPFRVLAAPEYWDPRRPTLPRRAAVSGFGFGGVNGHLLVESYVGQTFTTGLTPVRIPYPARTEPLGQVPPPPPPSRLMSKLAALMQKHPQAFPDLEPEPEPALDTAIAIVGVAVQAGPWADARAFQEFVFNDPATDPRPTFKRAGWANAPKPSPPGHTLDRVTVPLARFRTPPRELAEALPQQLLLLTTAAAALDDCHGAMPDTSGEHGDPRTGVFVGLTLDPNTTNFHLRWAAKGRGADPDTVGPPLTADRTMGALGSVAASRVARAFHFGGPSFTVCSEDSSATRAVILAVNALRAGELDRAVVGGVDLTGDPRAVLAADALKPLSSAGSATAFGATGAIVGEGAAAVVLKRLADANRDGDRVYAVIQGVGAAGGGVAGSVAPDAAAHAASLMRACTDANFDPASVELLHVAATGAADDDAPEAQALGAMLAARPPGRPLTVTAIRPRAGHLGAAAGLVSLVATAQALYQQLLPPGTPREQLPAELAVYQSAAAAKTRFWLLNADDGPRRALVAAASLDGTVGHVALEEYTPTTLPDGVIEVRDAERSQPLGLFPEAIFALEADTPEDLLAATAQLATRASRHTRAPIEALARNWFAQTGSQPAARRAVTLVARTASELLEQLSVVREHLRTRPGERFPVTGPEARPGLRDRVFYAPEPLGPSARVAIVFPGSGNQFPGMGRALGVLFPQVLRTQQAENARLRDQFQPELFWGTSLGESATDRDFLFGQVSLGTLTADLLARLGVPADLMLGQSLGESAGLFGLRVWMNRDEMFRRIHESSLFQSDLAPPYRAAARHFGTPPGTTVDWTAGVLTVPVDDVRAATRPGLRAFPLIAATPYETVIGGLRPDVQKLTERFPEAAFLPLSGVTIAHCEAAKPVEAAYRELHTLPVTLPPGLTVFSGAYARAYKPTPAACADSITAGLLNPIDFPAVIEAAYRDGARVFLEAGPGTSTTRAVTATLTGRPHLARAVCVPRPDDASLVLRLLANLVAERLQVTLAPLYADPVAAAGLMPPPDAVNVLTVMVGSHRADPALEMQNAELDEELAVDDVRPEPEPADTPVGVTGNGYYPSSSDDSAIDFSVPVDDLSQVSLSGVLAAIALETEAAEADEPAEPLPEPPPSSVTRIADLLADSEPESDSDKIVIIPIDVSADAPRPLADPFMFAAPLPSDLVSRLLGGDDDEDDGEPAPMVTEVPRTLSTEDCFTFARGRIGDVLGPTFAAIDAFPTRVRLPDGPLMLVDAIRTIEGEPLSLTRGRVVTEHTVHAERWYLDTGRCPVSVTVESGQADLFLAGFLGIDLQTEGRAVYRLLDAVVTFHRGLPTLGEQVVYDIYVDEFFRQADSWLFRFRFEGSVNGEPLLSMQNGVAGFFTAEALAAGQGIVHTRLDRQPMRGELPPGFAWPVSAEAGALTAEQVEALRSGDLDSAFGEAFQALHLPNPQRLPGGMLRLLDRVPLADPAGGRFGIGFVRGEYDIRPNEWFIECHFVDDPVMPGTLMYECCLHTLRVFLMRQGWIGPADTTACEPVPGVQSRLKCRGQVLQSTGTITYEITVKELGFRPEPFCIADALMLADGKPIVEITNLSLRLSGLTEEQLRMQWAEVAAPPATVPMSRTLRVPRPAPLKPVAFDKAAILAYSNGNPSEAFGEPYRVFDSTRVLARLPGPPFQFLDRVTEVVGEPFVLKAGAGCTAEYDVPPDAWYFTADRGRRMPFSVLLETALQPCGFLAAYCGSALTSDVDLRFRNLGGTATLHRPVLTDTGTLTTRVKLSRTASSAGMIIQHYDLAVTCAAGPVYTGTTYFGFFTQEALKAQVGMTTAKVASLPADAPGAGVVPRTAPFPADRFRMIDQIDGYLPSGGRAGLGHIQGRIAVDPAAWFFQAHFYQDPVWPGSLGLESFLQLLKYVHHERYGPPPGGEWRGLVPATPHAWEYRGQVLPTDTEVKVILEITAVDDARRRLTAAGYLTVDGRVIYKMDHFGLE